MSPATFNSIGNSSELDFNVQDCYTLEDAISMAEFQESLEDNELWLCLEVVEGEV